MFRNVLSDDISSVPLLLGCSGLFTTVLLLPIVVYTIVQGVSFCYYVLPWLLLKCVFGTLLPDFFWANAVLLTSATVATLGFMITIPLAFLSDALIMQRDIWTMDSVLGIFMVIFGFVYINFDHQQK